MVLRMAGRCDAKKREIFCLDCVSVAHDSVRRVLKIMGGIDRAAGRFCWRAAKNPCSGCGLERTRCGRMILMREGDKNCCDRLAAERFEQGGNVLFVVRTWIDNRYLAEAYDISASFRKSHRAGISRNHPADER